MQTPRRSEPRGRAARRPVVSLLPLLLCAACGARSGLDPDASNGDPDAEVCVEVPYREPIAPLDVSFTAQIVSADIVLLLDATGSMRNELRQIRRKLRSPIVPELLATIPDVEIGVATVQDFGLWYRDDEPFRLLQPMTSDLDAVEDALDAIELGNGGDHAEAQVEALYQIATGAGLEGWIPPADCPRHTAGYPCFRRDGARIVLLFTDALFHGGPSGEWPYADEIAAFGLASYEQAVRALRRIGARVLGLYGGLRLREPEHRTDLEAVARDTGAVRPDGEPIVFDIGSDGDWLDEGVVETVQQLVQEVPMDIDLLVEDYVGDEVDATRFVERIEAVRARPAGSGRASGEHFDAVQPGTRVTFRVHLRNDVVPRAEFPQRLLFRITLRGDGAVRLDSRLVQAVVPALGSAEGCSAPERLEERR